MTQTQLLLRNTYRWFVHHAALWLVLSSLYSLSVAVLLQTIVEQIQKKPVPLLPIWFAGMVLLLIPGALEKTPLPELPLSLTKKSFFSEQIWSRLGASSFLPLYLRHELRRTQTWITLILAVTLGALLPPERLALWIFVAQLPLQRGLWSIGGWRRIAVRTPGGPQLGGGLLLTAYLWSQGIQAAIALIAWAILLVFEGNWETGHFLQIAAATFSGVLCCAAVSMEGDAGRPWLVNFVGLSVALIASSLVYWQPALLILSAYIFSNLKHSVTYRLWSVEEFDEDAVLS
jgi:hypothetical protein